MKRHPQQPQSNPPPASPTRSSQPPRRKPETTVRPGTSVWLRPLAMLGGAWIVMVVVALTAVSGLLSPDASSGNRTTGAAIVRNTAQTAQLAKRQSRLPLWLFGAIALSCAAGCLFVSKQAARPPRSSTRSQKRMQPRHLKPSPAPIAPEPLLEPEPFQPSPPMPMTVPSFALTSRQAQATQAASRMAPVSLIQLAQTQLTQVGSAPAVETPTTVPVTVVPPGEKAPLDWGEASLADKLDLRKQRSVSSLL